MLDIVQILRRDRFRVFAEDVRREVLQSPPLCLPGFADRPAEGLLIRCHCHSLGNAYTRNSVPRAQVALRTSLVFEACRPALGPEGPAEPLFVRGHGASGRVGCGYAKLANDGEDRSCCFRSRLEFSPVTQSSIPETLKKYPCSVEK